MQFYLLRELKQPLKGSGNLLMTPDVSPGCEGPTQTPEKHRLGRDASRPNPHPREAQVWEKCIQIQEAHSSIFARPPQGAPWPQNLCPPLGAHHGPTGRLCLTGRPSPATAHNWAGPQDSTPMCPHLPAECPSTRTGPEPIQARSCKEP